jgi:MoaA/NifB/PqqE/SkfB family radical SAM enzyme
MKNRPAFDTVRVQMTFPCAARCRWCRTYLKNPTFAQMSRDGRTGQVTKFYLDVLKRYRPRVLAISGGEAILLPDIEEFLHRALKHCRTVHLYTSFQYPERVLTGLDWDRLPADRVVLTHSCIHFLPERWHELTQGFPHERYVANLRAARELRFLKRVKFVLNHADSDAEVALFLRMVEPDDRFELAYKLMNDQRNGYGDQVMRETGERVRGLLAQSSDSSQFRTRLPRPDRHVAEGVARDDILGCCQYRRRPLNLRFALWRTDAESVRLRVRFCPYFGPSTGHTFRLGRDPLKKIDQWFLGGEYRRQCGSCRLLHYSRQPPGGPGSDPENLTSEDPGPDHVSRPPLSQPLHRGE